MKLLTESKVSELMKQYWDFHDGLITRLEFRQSFGKGARLSVVIEIEQWNGKEKGKNNRYRFLLKDVGDFRMNGVNCGVFTIYHLNIIWHEEMVYFDFGGYDDHEIEHVLESPDYISAKEIYFEMEENEKGV